MNEDIIKKAIFWQILYIVIYGFCAVIINIYFTDVILFAFGIAGVVYILFSLFFIKYKRERLFINGIIGVWSVLFLGSWFRKQLELESTISIAAVVTVMDIVSFTRIGKRTVNAKAIANKSVAARLFVYGIEKNDVLIPTCGLGDYHTVRCYKEAFNKRQVLQVVLLSHHNQQSNRIDIPTAYEKNTIELPFWQAVLLCECSSM